MTRLLAGAADALVARAFSRVVDAWLPRHCGLCDLPLTPDEPGLCRGCLEALPGRLAARCPRCGVRVERAPGHAECGAAAPAFDAVCGRCRRAPPAFDRTVVLADYAPPIDRLIVALKFHGELALARPLGALLAARLHDEAVQPAEIVTWVPLAPQRLAARGFDQARAIARAAVRGLAGVRAAPLLRRGRETRPQSTLPFRQRLDNLAGAMHASGGAGGCVIVVDDVMTSGATLQAAAHALKRAGARTVINLVAARTP